MSQVRILVSRRGREDMEFACRVSDAAVREQIPHETINPRRFELARESIARNRVAKRLFGRSVFWFSSDQQYPHRGQIWSPTRGQPGSYDAVTGVIIMRVIDEVRS